MASSASPIQNRRHIVSDYTSLEAKALSEGIAAQTAGERAKYAEILKNIADAKKSAFESNLPRWREFLVSVLPLLTLLVGFCQFSRTQNQSREAHEDSEWRQALKNVSFRDRKASLMGAFAMQGFFKSDRYSSQAREIAGVLLPHTSNVGGFDEILVSMRQGTNDYNFKDVKGIGQKLGLDQRTRNGLGNQAPSDPPPFLTEDVNFMSLDEDLIEKDSKLQSQAAAWEIDSVSQALLALWRDQKMGLSPTGETLTTTVLENGTFDDLDFSDSNLRLSFLYHASFKRVKFRNAKLKGIFMDDVQLDGADFSGVSDYEDSEWGSSNWWTAKCVPPKMADYLEDGTGHKLSDTEKRELAKNCVAIP